MWTLSYLTVAFITFSLFAQVGSSTTAISPQNETTDIVSISSVSHFDTSLKRHTFSFVKFFSPLCPHCQQMAPAFLGLCSKLHALNMNESTARNQTVGCLEVDLTQSVNEPLANRFKVDGVPTLFLTSGPYNDITTEEYPGQRTTLAMYDFIVSAIALYNSPQVPHFESPQQLKNFIHKIGDRSLVLSVMHGSFEGSKFFPNYVFLPRSEWLRIMKVLRKQPAIRFGTVSTPNMLVPLPCSGRFRSVSIAHATLPIAFVAARASAVCDTGYWYFPGVRDGQSLSSFIHTSIVPSGSFTVLTSYNARHVFHSEHPLLFVFGFTDVPTGRAAYRLQVLSSIMRNTSFLPVYVKAFDFPGILAHVRELAGATNFSNLMVDGRNTSEVDTLSDAGVFAYRDSNHRPSASHLFETDVVEEWGRQQITTLGRETVITRANAVNRLTVQSWISLFEFDGRSVLLLLHLGKHHAHLTLLSNAARLLQNDAETLVVTSFNEGNTARPAWPDLSSISQLPALVLINPGQSPVLYNGIWTSRAIARFARNYGVSPSALNDGITWEDVALSCTFMIGLFLSITGIILLLKRYINVAIRNNMKRKKRLQVGAKHV